MGKGKVPLTEIKKIRAAQEQKKLEKRIPGSFTAQEYADETQLSYSRSRAILKNLIASGDLIVCKVPVMLSDGVISNRPGYRLAKRSHGEK